MVKHTVFIDGNVGTTGMQIEARLSEREDVKLLTIPEEKRKDPKAVREYMKKAEITFLCLPDQAAIEAAELSEGTGTRLIDASTAHRTDPAWVYGFPELGGEFRSRLKTSDKTAVPGCHASGFISLVRPLVEAGAVSKDVSLSCASLTGYSGGGKKLIAKYEGEERTDALKAPMPYALSLKHKHLPEMKAVCGLSKAPVFMPVVGDFYKGMLVSVPMNAEMLNIAPEEIRGVYEKAYGGSEFIKVMPENFDLAASGGFLSPELENGTNNLDIFVFRGGESVLLCSVFDNLGTGSGGAAVQCMNIMLGLPEKTGLN